MKAVKKIVIAIIVTVFFEPCFDIYAMKEQNQSTHVFNLEEQRVQERPIPDELRQPGDIWFVCGGMRYREVKFSSFDIQEHSQSTGDSVQKKNDCLELLPPANNTIFNLEEQKVQETPIPDELRQPGDVWFVCGGMRYREVKFSS